MNYGQLQGYSEVFVGRARYFVKHIDAIAGCAASYSVIREVNRRMTCGVLQRVSQPRIRAAAVEAFEALPQRLKAKQQAEAGK